MSAPDQTLMKPKIILSGIMSGKMIHPTQECLHAGLHLRFIQ